MKKTFFSLLFSAGIFLLAGLIRQDWPNAVEAGGNGEAQAGEAPVVTLTFDDGPHPVCTELLLLQVYGLHLQLLTGLPMLLQSLPANLLLTSSLMDSIMDSYRSAVQESHSCLLS